jgi:N-hydroxyarylamine O-acetyltransferase
MEDQEKINYLSRLNISDCKPNLEGLTQLQEHHLENIPFENLDIVVGRTITLDYPHLFDKIVLQKRGGYCFELNTLYAELLKAIGFSPKPVLGRVWLSNPNKTPPRNHLAYLVELNGRTYITDVGFAGLTSRIPLDINDPNPVNDNDGLMRVTKIADHEFMIQRHNEKEWTNLYSFENLEISEEDIDISNYYMSTHPNSHLIHHKCVGRNTKEGRIGLFNNKLSVRKGIRAAGKKRVSFGDDWIEAIKSEFSLNLNFSEEELNVLFEKN